MMESTKVRRSGGSLSIVIPKSVADAARLEEGDEVFISGSPEGVSFSAYDPGFAEAMEDLRGFMREHRDVYRELAK